MDTANNVLHIFFNNTPCGTLNFIDHGRDGFLLEFSYLPSWNGTPLSPHLPLGETRTGYPVWYFLQNILPEGDVLKIATLNTQIPLHDMPRFFAAFGRDCPGAISFHAEAHLPPQGYATLETTDLSQCLKVSATAPIPRSRRFAPQILYTLGGKPHMLLAGAQDKLGVAIGPDGELRLPQGSAASTHIIKACRSATYPCTALNEHPKYMRGSPCLQAWGGSALEYFQ